MESLGEALRRLPVSSVLADSEKLAEQVLKDPLVLEIREKYPEVPVSAFRSNLNRLYQMSKEARHCNECPGLERCPNDMQGHYTTITCSEVNGIWQVFDHKTACAKWSAYEQQLALRRKITSFYVDESMFNEKYDAVEMVSLDPSRQHAVQQILDYVASTIEHGLQKKGLYLMGDFGTGKTFLAGYLMQKLATAGYSGVIVYMPDFVEDAKALMLEPQKLKETISLMKDADLLVFDDIGAENLSPWVRDHVIGSILNHRMNRKPTFYTSNHDLDALERHLSFTHKDGEESHKGQRLMDRVRPFVEVVHVRGRNHRGG